MANAPTFQSPILFPREILAFKILQYSRTCVVRIATDSICFEKRLRNVSFVSLYGLSEKRKNYAPIYSRYNPANNVPNSRNSVGINLEDARKRRDLVDSIVFFHGLFSSERKWARTDFAMCSFLCTLVSTSDDP